MKPEISEKIRSSRYWLGLIVGAVIGGLIGNTVCGSGMLTGVLISQLVGAIIGLIIVKPGNWMLAIVTGIVTALLVDVFMWVFGAPAAYLTVGMIIGALIIGALAGVIVNYTQTSHTMRNVMHSPRFVVGFTIITVIVLTAVIYPMIDTRDPTMSYGDGFLKPGTYFSIYDANIAAYSSTTVHRVDDPLSTENRQEKFLPTSQLEVIVEYLARKSMWEQGHTIKSNYYSNTDGSRGDARDLSKDMEDAIAVLSKNLDAKKDEIASKQREIADPNTSENKRKNFEKAIPGLEADVAALEKQIADIRASYENGLVITDADAVRKFEVETGLSATSEHREELLKLWHEYYDLIILADNETAVAELGLNEIREGTSFKTGIGFIKDGLGYGNYELGLFERIGRALKIDPKGKLFYTQTSSTDSSNGITQDVKLTDYTTVSEVANAVNFPLGTDDAGHDMLNMEMHAIGKSLLIGLLAGTVATLLGLLVGLLAGYVGGKVDDILTFICNIFTVIPGFVLIIIIYNMVDKTSRGVWLCGLIIGFTSWVWTARSVRSQVISLRNRDHVNLSKLSGHSLFRIILTDILPYIASYVVMAFILQVSSGILAEAQLSILGLGPDKKDGYTLGLMMYWAKLMGAYTSSNAWWAYFPVIGAIALISFSLNLMNTGLDQVFNPTLRD